MQSLNLTSEEALVLFDLLSRWENDGTRLKCLHEAETKVLSIALLGQLEKSLTEPFHPNYAQLLEIARQRVLKSEAN